MSLCRTHVGCRTYLRMYFTLSTCLSLLLLCDYHSLAVTTVTVLSWCHASLHPFLSHLSHIRNVIRTYTVSLSLSNVTCMLPCTLSWCMHFSKIADLREFGAVYSQAGEEEQQTDQLQRKRPPPGQTKAAKYSCRHNAVAWCNAQHIRTITCYNIL